ncbi:MAG: hypothetical protein JKX92_06130 [Porticoccaceae bacterium]|nr:hypothetical protein [Porticoccaceae bacterium]
MTVSTGDLKQFRSAVVSNDPSNGGRLSTVEVSSGLAANLLAPASTAEQAAGFRHYRKTFMANHGVTAAVAAQVYVENYTPGGDELVFFAATQTDTQGAITGSEDLYGCGQLNGDLTAGATSLAVSVHDWANLPMFRNGTLLRISDKADINAVGNTEFIYIHASTPITAAGNVVTLPLATALAGNYTAASTRVSAVYEYGDIEALADAFVVTSAAGTYDGGTYPLSLDNSATVEQIWTLTFSDASNYSVAGDTLGNVGSGTVGGDFVPLNGAYAAPYFTLAQLGFGGTWAPGETLVFTTHPSAIPLWALRDGPAGIGAQASNTAVLALLAGSV